MKLRLLLITLLAFSFYLPAYAQTVSVSENLQAKKIQEERIKKHVKKAKELENKIVKMDGKIIKITADMNVLNDEIAQLDEKEKQARTRLKRKLNTFNNTAVTIARLERMPVEAMAAASSLRAAHNRKGVVESGRKSLSGQISKNRNDIYELQVIKDERHGLVKKTESLRGRRLSEKKRLEKLFKRQVKLLSADDAERAKLLKRAYKMKQKKTLSSLLTSYKKIDTYLPKSRSKLKTLPVKGRIVRGYKEQNRQGVKSHGITIETTPSAPVTAIKDGRIIYSDRFREYDYIVILEHEDGSNSLYSGMERSDMKVGDFLQTGKALGYMSKDEKPELYLEIRKNGETVSPTKYLTNK